MKEHLLEIFREEAGEQLANLESVLLELDRGVGNPELVNAVFRALHTIKGSAGMFGLDVISVFAHRVESVLDLVRSGELSVSPELITLVLRANDIMRKMIFNADAVCSDDTAEVIKGFQDIIGSVNLPPFQEASGQPEILSQEESVEQIFRIALSVDPSILKHGINPLEMIQELSTLGPCTLVANPGTIPSLQEINPSICYVAWEATLTTFAGINAIHDVFIFMHDHCNLVVEEISAVKASAGDEYLNEPMLGEILVRRGDLDRDHLERLLSSQKRLGEILVESGAVAPERLDSALSEQLHIREFNRQRKAREGGASLRVPAIKLDQLMNLVGELVTTQGRLSLCASDFNSVDLYCQRDQYQMFELWDTIGDRLRDVAEEMERLTVEMRESVMGMRLLPIGTTFVRLGRLVRDLATELGKDVEMETEGDDTELDKTAIERLVDPLVHIIRNSVDHGIEKSDIRVACGKPARGVIRIAATHVGESVQIVVSDDGSGLDTESIRNKAVARGLIQADAKLEEHDLFQLICKPGFSTSNEITTVSGRGVGMDVVSRAITSLNGSLEISSIRGSGTTMIIRLPLTLAIIETLIVRVGSELFQIPLNQVEECIDYAGHGSDSCSGSNIISLRGAPLPFIPLRERFIITGERPEFEQIVVARCVDSRFGLLVDEVICQHQSVIKKLGRFYNGVKGVSGATIMGDGSVSLVLDLPALLAMEEAFDSRPLGSIRVVCSTVADEIDQEVCL